MKHKTQADHLQEKRPRGPLFLCFMRDSNLLGCHQIIDDDESGIAFDAAVFGITFVNTILVQAAFIPDSIEDGAIRAHADLAFGLCGCIIAGVFGQPVPDGHSIASVVAIAVGVDDFGLGVVGFAQIGAVTVVQVKLTDPASNPDPSTSTNQETSQESSSTKVPEPSGEMTNGPGPGSPSPSTSGTMGRRMGRFAHQKI